jgi:hypothetical protein
MLYELGEREKGDGLNRWIWQITKGSLIQREYVTCLIRLRIKGFNREKGQDKTDLLKLIKELKQFCLDWTEWAPANVTGLGV